MVTAAPNQALPAATRVLLDQIELEVLRAADTVQYQLAYSHLQRRTGDVYRPVLLVASKRATGPEAAEDWREDIKHKLVDVGAQETCGHFAGKHQFHEIDVLESGRLAPALIVYRAELGSTPPAQSSSPTPLTLSSPTAQPVAVSQQQVHSSGGRSTATLPPTSVLAISRLTTDDKCNMRVVNGNIKRIPERIFNLYVEYSKSTTKLWIWLKTRQCQFVDEDQSEFGYKQGKPHDLADKIVDLQENIRQRKIVCAWYKNATAYHRLDTANTAARRKHDSHEHFISVLEFVLDELVKWPDWPNIRL